MGLTSDLILLSLIIIANYPPFVHMGNLFGKLILQIENRLGLW